ncbi:hypothetical protein G6F46_014100 [Rhizopus delemar]|nr:hypothetical protein G6F46_014100 [Rhizopus delemar]
MNPKSRRPSARSGSALAWQLSSAKWRVPALDSDSSPRTKSQRVSQRAVRSLPTKPSMAGSSPVVSDARSACNALACSCQLPSCQVVVRVRRSCAPEVLAPWAIETSALPSTRP